MKKIIFTLISSLMATQVYASTSYDQLDSVVSAPLVELLKSNALQNNTDTQELLADLYRLGLSNTPKNFIESKYWYDLAAKNDSPHAQMQLSWIHFFGLGTPRDFKKWDINLTSAANNGHSSAQALMGVRSEYGNMVGYGVLPNLKDAKDWYDMSCDSGNKLGCLLTEGIKRSSWTGNYNYTRPHVKKYIEMANDGNGFVQAHLGRMYLEGYGVWKSTRKAKHWLQTACDNGYRSSCRLYQDAFRS